MGIQANASYLMTVLSENFYHLVPMCFVYSETLNDFFLFFVCFFTPQQKMEYGGKG